MQRSAYPLRSSWAGVASPLATRFCSSPVGNAAILMLRINPKLRLRRPPARRGPRIRLLSAPRSSRRRCRGGRRPSPCRVEPADRASIGVDHLAAAEWRAHLPGQYYTIRLTVPDGYQAIRSYSVASSPLDEGEIELTVDCLTDGEVSPFPHDVVEVSDELEVRGPLTEYVTWQGSSPLLLVGGGSGVVPLMCMLRHRRRAFPQVPRGCCTRCARPTMSSTAQSSVKRPAAAYATYRSPWTSCSKRRSTRPSASCRDPEADQRDVDDERHRRYLLRVQQIMLLNRLQQTRGPWRARQRSRPRGAWSPAGLTGCSCRPARTAH